MHTTMKEPGSDNDLYGGHRAQSDMALYNSHSQETDSYSQSDAALYGGRTNYDDHSESDIDSDSHSRSDVTNENDDSDTEIVRTENDDDEPMDGSDFEAQDAFLQTGNS